MMLTKIDVKSCTMAVVLALLILVAGQGSADAASLWSDQGNMFSDRKAHAVGDTLTILISENSTASRTGKASNSKSASGSAEAGVGIFKFIGDASLGSKDSFQASGSLTNTNTVTGKITVQVTAIKPNGNLLIAGNQLIRQNNEEQRIVINGEVRPDDIAADNSVLSNYVANAEIRVDGKGPIAGKQRQGLLTQLFNFLF